MLPHMLRAVAGRPTKNELLYVTAVSQAQTSSPTGTYTFSNVSLGDTFGGRRIILALSYFATGSSLSGMGAPTVAGNATSQLTSTSAFGGGSARQVSFYSITDTTNTTATIQASISNPSLPGTSSCCIIHVYSLNSPKLTASGLGSDDSSPFTLTTNFAADSLALYGGRCADGATTSWTNATEQAETAVSGQFTFSSASYYPAAAGSRTVTFTPTDDTNALLLGVQWS